LLRNIIQHKLYIFLDIEAMQVIIGLLKTKIKNEGDKK